MKRDNFTCDPLRGREIDFSLLLLFEMSITMLVSECVCVSSIDSGGESKEGFINW